MTMTLAPPPLRHHNGDVSELRAVLRRVMEKAPGSVRDLARAAGVSHTLLVRIRDGERRLTPETREALTAALRDWGDTCYGLADALEAAAHAESEGDDE